MIRYDLTCAKGHAFDSWFASANAYDTLERAGQLSCALCGDTHVSKALMAPSVAEGSAARPKRLSEPANPLEQALAELRRKVEATSDYVGPSFASEARAMHEGKTPERAIHGEARPDEARRLIEDGIPVAPLPFAPRRKTN